MTRRIKGTLNVSLSWFSCGELLRMRIVLSKKPQSKVADDVAQRVRELLQRNGVEVCEFPNCSPCDSDGIVVVGGDGTLLYTLSLADCETPPIMTVRAGRRAFLLDVEPNELEYAINRFLNGEYWAEKHKRLEINKGIYAMNEVVVLSKGRRVTRLNVKVEDTVIYEGLEGDGVIVSTTLGSTAYALSAGGPLVDPRAEVMIIVPVNPIHLNVRSVVLPPSVTVHVDVTDNSSETFVLVDGVKEIYDKELEISLTGPSVTFARFKPRRFYEKLIELRSLYPRRP